MIQVRIKGGVVWQTYLLNPQHITLVNLSEHVIFLVDHTYGLNIHPDDWLNLLSQIDHASYLDELAKK